MRGVAGEVIYLGGSRRGDGITCGVRGWFSTRYGFVSFQIKKREEEDW